MILATLNHNDTECVALRIRSGFVPVETLNRQFGFGWPIRLLELITSGQFTEMHRWYRTGGWKAAEEMGADAISLDTATFGPLYRRPRKIWGIGLNYARHARDLDESSPQQIPASFMRPDTALIGPGDTIRIPHQSHKTTAEAELGVVIGRTARDVPEADWLEVVAGFTTIIDVTAEDILRRNPRYLTLAKSFDTFFSFGPTLLTPDEVPDLMNLAVSTVINGTVYAEDTIKGMMFPPDRLVGFHSRVMTLLPGDIISTGTPGAVPIRDHDTVECRIDGFLPLVNQVRDLKISEDIRS